MKRLDRNGSFPSHSEGSPEKLFLITLAGIFLAEVIAMMVIYVVKPASYWLGTLLDALIMLVMIFPLVYYFSFRILIREINVRKRGEALLLNVLETMPVGVWLTDERGNILHGNPASQELWCGARYVGVNGYGEYKGWWVDSGKDIGPEDWAVVRTIRYGERVLDEEIEIECFDGTHKFILNSSVPILEDGEIRGAIIINQDITERKQATEAILRSNELLRSVFNSVDVLFAYLDRDFNFLQVNETYARFGGYPADYFIGKNHFDLYPHTENQSIFQRVVDSGEPYVVLEKPFEYPEFPERGVTYWDWSLQPVRGVGGSVVGIVLSLVDVSERRRAELQLERQNQELRDLYNAERRAHRATETLTTAAMALAESLDQDHILATLMEHINQMIPSDVSGVGLLDEADRLVVRVSDGYSAWTGPEFILPIPSEGSTAALFEKVITSRKFELVEDAAVYPLNMNDPELAQIRNWLLAPIVAHDHAIGVVGLGKAQPGFYTREQVQWVVALATQAAVAIQNAWLFEQVRSSSERLQSLARKLVDIQERERVYVARELHDEAGQALTTIKLSLGRLEQDPDCPERVRTRLRELKKMADGVMEDLHQLAVNLRPASLDHLGLVHALEQYAKTIATEGLSVEFKALGFNGGRLAPIVETALYRIAQEALTNVIRHAQAKTVGILLERHAGKAILFIEDDGIGFDPTQIDANRMGVEGMRERAVLIGGSLLIESTSGAGTSIRVEVSDAFENSDRG